MSKFGKLLEDWFDICDHDWGKWVERTTTKTFHLTGQTMGCTVQTRCCKKCGQTVLKEIERA